MTHEQALEVLKEQLETSIYNFGEANELTQALTIAIEVMEDMPDAMMSAYTVGYIASSKGEEHNPKQWYNYLTKTETP